jgi:signal transduction histidine kinase
VLEPAILIAVVFIGSAAILILALAARSWRRWRIERAQLNRKVSDLSAHVSVLEKSTSEPFLRFESTGLIRTVNVAAEELFGYSAEELLGQNIVKLVPEVLSNSRLSDTVEVRHKDGSFVRLPFTAVKTESPRLMRGPQKPTSIYLFFGRRDEPPQASATDAREASSGDVPPPLSTQPMPPFAARIVGHVVARFENLLTVIGGYSGLALTETPDANPWRSELQEIAAATEQASRLTRHLAGLAGNNHIPVEPVDLNRVIEDMRLRIQQAVPCQIKFDLQPLAAKTFANADRLREAILLLCSNVRQRAGEACRLEVRTQGLATTAPRFVESGLLGPGTYGVLTFFDTGKPFDFNGADACIELSAIYGFVLSAGGGIDIKSSAVEGTTFEILLPCP